MARIHLLALVSLLGAAAAAPDARLEEVGRRTWTALWEFHPVDATRAGCHDYDSHLGNYTKARTTAFLLRLDRLSSELAGIDTARLPVDGRIDWLLLRSTIETERFWLVRRRPLETNPYFYADECVQGVYTLLLRDFAPLPRRAELVLGRLNEIPRLVAAARHTVKDPPQLHCEAAIEQLATGSEFIWQACRDLGREVPSLRDRLLSAGTRATSAMNAWREELRQLRSSLKPGFAMGRDDYDYYLRTNYSLGFDSDSLLRLGQNLFARTDSAIRELRRQRSAWDSLHPSAPAAEPPVPPGFSRADYFARRQQETDSMRAWVAASGFATVPAWVGPLVTVETPVFLRSIIPGIAMEPAAPLDSVQTSYMYIPPVPDPLDSLGRRDYFRRTLNHGPRGGIVHEGFPGHHFQMSLANHHSSFIRRLQWHTPFIEGWALYCEQAVVEQGLYPPDPFPDLRWLGGVKFRAARVIVDVQLHTGRMSYDDAWRFMARNCWADSAFMQAEVRRYCMSPGQPMSYLLGKTQLLALREEYRARVGEQFTTRDFHDRLLAEGSIPVSLIRRKLLAGR